MTKAEYAHLNKDIGEVKVDIKAIEATVGKIEVDVARIMTTMKIRHNDKLRNMAIAAIAGFLPAAGVAIYVLIQLN